MQEARNTNYIATWVAGLYEYGKYLYQQGETESGMAHLGEAMQLATEKGMLGQARNIEAVCLELGITLE